MSSCAKNKLPTIARDVINVALRSKLISRKVRIDDVICSRLSTCGMTCHHMMIMLEMLSIATKKTRFLDQVFMIKVSDVYLGDAFSAI